MNAINWAKLRPALIFPLIGILCQCSTTKAPDKLNVLYIMTDDHAAPALGIYNGRLATLNPSPNLDQLAREGVAFKNTFVTNSICTPSRASILTGQYSQTNTVLDLYGSLPKERQLLPTAMSKAGYETAIVGKWHLKSEPSAFDFYKVLPVQGKYFDPDFRTRGIKDWPNNVINYKGHSSDVVSDETINWLKSRKDARPFFLMMQFKAPHDYFEYAPRYASYLQDTLIPEPDDLYEQSAKSGSVATRGNNDALRREIGTSIGRRNTRRNYGTDFGLSKELSDKEFSHQAYQKYLKDYLRCVKGVDDNIAKVIHYLKRNNLYDNTIIVYTSDQGMMLGEHDLIDKRWMYEESIQMPLIIRHPHRKAQTQLNPTLINNTDFAPTLIDLVDGHIPSEMQGKSFNEAINGGKPKNWRTATYYRYWMHRAHHDVPAHFGVRSERYKLIFFYGAHYQTGKSFYYQSGYTLASGKNPVEENTPPAWEFYDLQKDPKETLNLYGHPDYINVIQKLKTELKVQRKEFNETDSAYPHLEKIIETHWDD